MWTFPPVESRDSAPKWFTEVQLDLHEGWVESTIAPVPPLVYDDTALTRVEFRTQEAPVIPASTLGA